MSVHRTIGPLVCHWQQTSLKLKSYCHFQMTMTFEHLFLVNFLHKLNVSATGATGHKMKEKTLIKNLCSVTGGSKYFYYFGWSSHVIQTEMAMVK